MGWLNRLFGKNKTATAASVFKQSEAQEVVSEAPPNTPSIPAERKGLHGEYDESGLAKRVALALDEDPDLDDIETVYIAQTGGRVVVKGRVPSQDLLNQIVNVAKRVEGATGVDTNQVELG